MFFFSPFPGITGLTTAHKNSHDLKLILPFLTMDANGVLRQTNPPYCNHWSSAKESPIPAGDQYFDRIVISIGIINWKSSIREVSLFYTSLTHWWSDNINNACILYEHINLVNLFFLFFFVMISNNSDYDPLENIKHFCQKESFEVKDSGSHQLPPFYAPC